jgi:hypothetical protein
MKKTLRRLLLTISVFVTATYTNAMPMPMATGGCVAAENIKLSKSVDDVIKVNVLNNNSNWTVANVNILSNNSDWVETSDEGIKDYKGNVVFFNFTPGSEATMTCNYKVKNEKGEDEGMLGLLKTKVSFITFRVCNFYTDPITWSAVSTGSIKYVLTNNDIVLSPSDGVSGKCGDISLRVPESGYTEKVVLSYDRPKYGNKGTIDIGNITDGVISDPSWARPSGPGMSKIIKITNVARTPTTNNDVLSVYYRSENNAAVEQHRRFILRTGAQLSKYEVIPNSSADFTICLGDKVNDKCSSTTFAQ